jgi:hypothetical protein
MFCARQKFNVCEKDILNLAYRHLAKIYTRLHVQLNCFVLSVSVSIVGSLTPATLSMTSIDAGSELVRLRMKSAVVELPFPAVRRATTT